MSRHEYLQVRTRTLALLRTLRDNLDWQDAEQKQNLLDTLVPSLKDWSHILLPPISTIFDRDQIEHLIVASFDSDQQMRFVDFLIESGYRDQPVRASHVTPLLHAAKERYRNGFWNYELRVLAPKLFKIYDSYEVNYRDEETGLSHFHVACMTGCHETVAKFLERGAIDDVNRQQTLPETDDTPLHLAMKAQSKKLAELLLKHGANPNAVNREGLTPLLIASQSLLGVDILAMILKLVKFGPLSPGRRELQVNVQDRQRNTALHYALSNGLWQMAELLLLCRANVGLSNRDGATPLHIITQNYLGARLARFFELCDLNQQRLLVDARDKAGNTALHLAILKDHRPSIELLLARGADPNAANRAGSTPLHLITDKPYDEELAVFFLNECFKHNKTVYINEKDGQGMTPLQLSMKNIHPYLCSMLMKSLGDDHLADFRFPSQYRDIGPCFVDTRLKAAADLMWIKEMLAIRTCEPVYEEVSAMLEFFHRSGMFENGGYQREIKELRQLPECNSFVVWARESELIPGLSLWDMIQLEPGQQHQHQRLEYWKYSRIARTWKLVDLWWEHQPACFGHMLELALRDFCRKWAVESLMALTRYRLPHVPCWVIINEEFTNLQLYNLCKAWDLTE